MPLRAIANVLREKRILFRREFSVMLSAMDSTIANIAGKTGAGKNS
jgi:hypothetical protein